MSADVDEARAALLRLMPYSETHDLLDALEAAIRAEYEGPAKRGYDDGMRVARAESHTAEAHDECSAETCEVEALVRSLIARAVSAEAKLAALREAAQTYADRHPCKSGCLARVALRAALAATPAEDEEGRT